MLIVGYYCFFFLLCAVRLIAAEYILRAFWTARRWSRRECLATWVELGLNAINIGVLFYAIYGAAAPLPPQISIKNAAFVVLMSAYSVLYWERVIGHVRQLQRTLESPGVME